MKAFLTGVLEGLCVVAVAPLLIFVLALILGISVVVALGVANHFGTSIVVLVVVFLLFCGISNSVPRKKI